jgi:ABC-type transport system involved in multi-copper enzyme maturation permease subunit
MSTLTVNDAGTAVAPRPRRKPAPIPASRIVKVEFRKMFDTRAGFWLMASIGILAVLATVAVIAFAPDEAQTLDTYATAFGFPMAVILPMVAILSVTSEWSQRSGLTTFTQVPSRGRVVAAKAFCAVVVGVVSMLVALGIGSLGNLVGTAISGAPTTWDLGASAFANIMLAQVLGMMVGFMLGVLIRNSAGAIVAYFVYSLLLPTVFGMLAAFQDWFSDLQPWVDFNYSSTRLYDNTMTGEYWAQLGVSGLIWLVVPLGVGLVMLLRSEVK